MGRRFAGAPSELERRIRVAGMLLLVAALLVVQVAERFAVRSSNDLRWLYQVNTVCALVLAPAGAMLLAVSIVVRGVTRGAGAAFRRGQLVVGVALVVLGVLSMWNGGNALAAVEEFLGPTGRPGAFLIGLIARAVGLAMLPLGLALLTLMPLYWLMGSEGRVVPGRAPGSPDDALHDVE